MLTAALIAASVVTLHCEVFDITTGERQGDARRFAVTVDYSESFAYFTGSDLFEEPVGIGNLQVTPDRISIPAQRVEQIKQFKGGRISRMTGEVQIQLYDLQQEISDLSQQNPREGRSTYAGACRSGAFVPIPSARF